MQELLLDIEPGPTGTYRVHLKEPGGIAVIDPVQWDVDLPVAKTSLDEGLDTLQGPVRLLIYIGHSEIPGVGNRGTEPASLSVTIPGEPGNLMPLSRLLKRIQATTRAPVSAVYLAACGSAVAWRLLGQGSLLGTCGPTGTIWSGTWSTKLSLEEMLR